MSVYLRAPKSGTWVVVGRCGLWSPVQGGGGGEAHDA